MRPQNSPDGKTEKVVPYLSLWLHVHVQKAKQDNIMTNSSSLYGTREPLKLPQFVYST